MAPWMLAAIGAAVLAVVVITVLRITGLRSHRARQALEPAAPPSPVPAARLRRAANPREVTAVRAPAVRLLLRDVLVEAEIEHAAEEQPHGRRADRGHLAQVRRTAQPRGGDGRRRRGGLERLPGAM